MGSCTKFLMMGVAVFGASFLITPSEALPCDFWGKFRETVIPEPDKPQNNNPPKEMRRPKPVDKPKPAPKPQPSKPPRQV